MVTSRASVQLYIFDLLSYLDSNSRESHWEPLKVKIGGVGGGKG